MPNTSLQGSIDHRQLMSLCNTTKQQLGLSGSWSRVRFTPSLAGSVCMRAPDEFDPTSEGCTWAGLLCNPYHNLTALPAAWWLLLLHTAE
jgi:hypothetical protein